MARTPGSHPGNRSPILLSATSKKSPLNAEIFVCSALRENRTGASRMRVGCEHPVCSAQASSQSEEAILLSATNLKAPIHGAFKFVLILFPNKKAGFLKSTFFNYFF